MMKALFIYGTRPEAIKLAPVILECRRRRTLHAVLCATAQHRELLDEVTETFQLEPDYDLELMRPDQTLTALTASAITAIARVVDEVRPNVVVVQGDTTSALAGALTAFYHRVPVAHVEAGLRTHDLDAPYPEEMNRQVVARITRWHFAPTDGARDNLLGENIPSGRILVTGNTAIDALRIALEGSRGGPETIREQLRLPPPNKNERLIAVTAHRRENFGEPIRDLCRALLAVADGWPEVRIVYPVHPNPNVRGPVREILSAHPRIHLVEPVEYRTFVRLLQDAWLVLTDSGGIQEEAPWLGKPILVLREVTERPEAVAAGTARLVGTSPQRIVSAVSELFSNPESYAAMARARNPFGDGYSAERIVERLTADLS